MAEHHPLPTPSFALRPRRSQEIKRSDGSSDTTKREHVFITHIRATDVVSGLRRLPAGFYVAVQINDKTTKSSNKPVLVGEDVVEWDEEILLPSDRSSSISFAVYASFELGPRLGNGELLHQLKITVGDVLDRDEQLQPISFLVQRDEIFPSCSSIRIITERRTCDINESTTALCLPKADTISQLEQLTDTGHCALLRYRQLQNQTDLDEAITCFERVRDMCPTDHPNRSAVLFNLANAKFIHCQTNNHSLDLDVPITLYQDALQFRSISHPDHCATLLDLGFALLIRSQRRGSEADKTEAKDLLSGVVKISSAESYAYRAALLALRMSEISVSIQMMESGISETEHVDPYDEELIRGSRTTVPDLLDRDSHQAAVLANVGSQFFLRFERDGDLVHIHVAISMFEHAMQLTPDGHPRKPAFLYLLGTSLSHRFERLGDLADMNKSISMFEEAVRLAPNNKPDKPAWLDDLGSSLLRRFERFSDLADIDKSVSVFEEAVRLTPNDHPNKPVRLYNFGCSLLCRFRRLGDRADIDKSISMVEEAVHLTPNHHPDKPAQLSYLGNSLLSRFERLGDLADIDKSISMVEEGVRLTPDGHPDKPVRWNILANSLLRRFQCLGDLADIDTSILMLEEVVCLTPNGHPSKSARLSSLGSSLLCRFERAGDPADIDKSISMAEEAMRLIPNGHPSKLARLNSLGNSLLSRFERFGDFADINKSISMAEEAVRLTPDGHPDKPARWNTLGSSFFRRFERFDDLSDIDKSISMFEEVMRLTPDGHPNKPARLNNLGNSLFRRFQRLGDIADLNKSILMKEEAVHLTPSGHPDEPVRLNDLGSSLLSRFERVGDLADIDKSILMKEKAVDLAPNDHPKKPIWLDNLANSLSSRFRYLGDIADIDKSISVAEEALDLTPNGHPDKPARLNDLGSSLLNRFQHLGDIADIHKSILMLEKAVCLTPDGHPDKPGRMINLGDAFMDFFEHSRDPSHLSAATLHFSVASHASTGPTSIRFRAARSWISSVRLQGNSQALLDAYTTTINLLPQLAWLGLPLTERHRLLLEAADVARDAAAAALDAGRPEMAVEWLEQGRSIVWSQFLQLRTPVDELHAEHPDLADRFQQISQELEHASSREHATSGGSANDSVDDTRSLEEEVQKHHDLALRRERLLADIRSLPGFDRFLLPNTIEKLTALAHSGPVVYLNVSKQRCDALIVAEKLGGVIPVPLRGISYRDVERLLRVLLKRNHPVIPRDDISAREGAVIIEGFTTDDRFRWILESLWKNVINPVLEALGLLTPPPGTEKMTHIYWCPTGPFAFLPIHAAGCYDAAGEAGAKLSDFAISSYIPSLSALASPAQKDSNGSSPNIRLAAIPQPPEDGQFRLPCVKEEIDRIRELSANSSFVTLQDSHGTVEDVIEKMKNVDWVHFACHGVQDPRNPLDSGLCLANRRRLKLSDIIQLARPQGGLAFLSACQTAQGDVNLPEESVHLAAGMLLAGYGGVIATMWSIMDRDAPKVTQNVYEHLFRDSKVPDSTEAAEALHHAVRHLRDSGASFSSWVPFIHVGR